MVHAVRDFPCAFSRFNTMLIKKIVSAWKCLTVPRHIAVTQWIVMWLLRSPAWGSVPTFSLISLSSPVPPYWHAWHCLRERVWKREKGNSALAGHPTANPSTPPTHLVTLGLLPAFFSTLVFSWVSSYTRVSENRGNIREGTFQILLVEWSANVSNSCLHLRGQKSAILSKEWQMLLGISFRVGPVGDTFFTCSLGIGPSILPSVFHLMGRVTSGGLIPILREGMRTSCV